MRVLLVDDETEFVTTLAERLSLRGFTVDFATRATDALALVDQHPYDLAILDMKMPVTSGLELKALLTEKAPLLKFIFLTGHGSEKDRAEALRLGAFAYLNKPVEMENLVKTLKDAYKKKLDQGMVAAAFAEEGEFGTAQEIMDEKKK